MIVGSTRIDLPSRSKIHKLSRISMLFGLGESNLVYANGPDEAEKIALQLKNLLVEREPTQRQTALAQLIKDSVHEQFLLAECVLKGVGFHYSNIPTIARQEVENAFSTGDLDYLVSTSTLLQGVNLPVKNIFMLSPTKGQNMPLDSIDFWNLSGRAGRLREEFQGNIFLIDYQLWPKKALNGPKDNNIRPAIETAVQARQNDLINTIQTDDRKQVRKQQIDLDTAFVRLFVDMKKGELPKTLQRTGVRKKDAELLSDALKNAAKRVTLPPDVLLRAPNVSAYKQQKLYLRIVEKIQSDPKASTQLIPLHPHEPRSFVSYASILELCHEIILGYDTSRRLHRFHAVMAWQWMRGWPIPRIIDRQIKRQPKVDLRKVIRDTLNVIENDIRFQTVRLFACYNSILEYVLLETGASELSRGIPELALFLEIGASNKTTVSFIALGLSRATAIRLNGWCSDEEQEMDTAEALRWLRAKRLEELELPELLLREVRAVLEKIAQS